MINLLSSPIIGCSLMSDDITLIKDLVISIEKLIEEPQNYFQQIETKH